MPTDPLSLLVTPAPPAGPRPLPEAQVLRALWRQTDDSQRWISAVRIRQAVRLSRPEFAAAIQSLAMDALVRRRIGLQLALTGAGVAAARAAAFQPEDALGDEAPSKDIHPAVEAPPPASSEPALVSTLAASLSHGLLGASAENSTAAASAAAPLPLPQPHAEDDDIDLRLLCQAIGLDPEELNGRPPAPVPAAAPVPAPVPAPALSPVSASVAAARPNSAAAVARLLLGLMLEVPRLGLSLDDEAEAEAEIATSNAQLLSPRPKPVIVATSLSALLTVLEGAGLRLSPDLQEKLTQVRLFLSQLQA